MDCSLLGSSAHGILQARILEWVAMPFSRGSSQPRNWTQVSCTAGRFFTNWATREASRLYMSPLLWELLMAACVHASVCAKLLQSCPSLCDPIDIAQQAPLLMVATMSYSSFYPKWLTHRRCLTNISVLSRVRLCWLWGFIPPLVLTSQGSTLHRRLLNHAHASTLSPDMCQENAGMTNTSIISPPDGLDTTLLCLMYFKLSVKVENR